MRGCCLRCLRGLVQRAVKPVLHEDDTEEGAMIKKVSVPIMMIVVALCVASALFVNTTASIALAVALATGIVTSLVVYCTWLVCPLADMRVFGLSGYLVAVLLGDVHTLSVGGQMWSLAVLVMDGALVFNMDHKIIQRMVVSVLAYLVLISADTCIAGWYRHVGSGVPPLCDCGDPPCVVPPYGAASYLLWAASVFLCDFFLTRGFATGLRHQISVVRQAITVTEAIAQFLSLYEVEEGRALLEGEDSDKLPEGLKCALLRLLNNLNEYKPYLPDAMLVREGEELSTAEPPGLGQEEPEVTMVFTDIQSSTELWEKHPQGMYTGLQTHNSTIRKVVHSCGGYEVKVIGDAFMLAFKTVEDGCRFAIDAQVALTEAKWPSDLLQHPLCCPVQGQSGRMLWCGPRVRIGVHCGAVRVEKNPVTGRCDYFGPTVNTAARVESCLRHGGLTGVTKAVMDELTPAAMSRLGEPASSLLGRRELRGVAEAVEVTVLFRRELAERDGVLAAAVPAHRRTAGSVLSAASSSTTASTPSRVCHRRNTLLQDALTKRPGTCASFRARVVADQGTDLAEMLEAVEQAADMTQGVVAGAMSLLCVVVWNGPRACSDHCGQCLRATDFVRRWRPDRAAAGASSGELLHGTISAGRRKHAAVIGGCVELSAALAEGAEQSGEALLAAGTFGRYCSTQNRTRRHAHWGVHGSSDTVELWAVREAKDADDALVSNLTNDGDESLGVFDEEVGGWTAPVESLKPPDTVGTSGLPSPQTVVLGIGVL